MKLLFDDIKSARWAIILIIAYFAFLKDKIHSICPLVIVTGYPCPGCGMTRAALCLLKLDFEGAWEMHPFIYAMVILAIWFGWNRYVLKKRDMKDWFSAVVIVAIGMCIFYIWRMYRFFPGDAPMNYYYGSLYGKIQNLIR